MRRRRISRPHLLPCSCIKIVKIRGEFTWPAGTGEFFLVPGRQLTIQMHDRNVVLAPRELAAVPRRVGHRPQAGSETAALLFEPGTVISTGDADGAPAAKVEKPA